jgi:Carbohydrate family 9 binding domain-like
MTALRIAVPALVSALLAFAVTPPEKYACHRANAPVAVDGRLDEAAWRDAPWTSNFVDIEGPSKPKPRFRTRAKMLWDDRYFYVAAELEEPHVWGSLTEHDAVICMDNDFEVFIDPDGNKADYYEFEINALNTGWDLFLPKAYRDGGKADNGWQMPALKTAVRVDGTLNNPGDTDHGWSLEIAIPWDAMKAHANRRVPPAEGNEWRVNFSRVEWKHEIAGGKYRKVEGVREDNWVWSPQWAIDMHRPEHWGYVRFGK